MKRMIIAAVVGGIIMFVCQFLSWAALNLHKKANGYTPNGTAIMTALQANLPEEGGYMIPGLPETATSEEHEKAMKEYDGKPWASIQYHKAMEASVRAMVTNMVRGLLVNIVMMWMFCWILLKLANPAFGTILTASIFTGFIVFFNSAYTNNIWFKTFDLMAHFGDAIISWGLCGLWFGWYLKKRSTYP
jgi:hypothetical protein